MNLDPVIERLADAQLGFKVVEGIDALGDIETTPIATPALFVVPAAESFLEAQNGPGLVLVESSFEFEAVVVVTLAATRGQVRGELRRLADAVTANLLGWSPDGAIYRPFVPVSGRLAGLGGGRASWAVRFRTLYRIRKQG